MKYSKYSTSSFKNVNVYKTIKHKSIDKYAKDYNRELKNKSKVDKNIDTSNKSKFGSIFAILLLILFIISFSHYIRTGSFSNITFKSLIDWFADMPDVSFNFLSVDLTIYGDWGAFNFFRYWVNSLSSLLELSISMVGMISQSLIVIIYLVGILFI